MVRFLPTIASSSLHGACQPAAKIRHGQGKWPLRRVLRQYLPESPFLNDLSKGSTFLSASGCEGPLREWAQGVA